MPFAFPPAPQPSVAITDCVERFPVRRVFCVGRNYRKHAVEMGHDPDREPPFFFSKPADAVVDCTPTVSACVPYPPLTQQLHHEVELVVAIGAGGRNLSPSDALAHIYGYTVGVDLTRRDLQAAAKAARRPWDWGKAFDHSAPVGALRTVAGVGHTHSERIWLKVDGDVRQDADLGELIWKVPEVLAFLSRSVALEAGDLVFTGTPAGVGPIVAGQHVRAGVEGVAELGFTVGAPV
ncbi:MAG: fumarylacetoacetate hydrolase family protein [Proteobacteria bacterium]|nr:fumarylacetoacetate hydrolase family protein [Pseudomonadota bacterium]